MHYVGAAPRFFWLDDEPTHPAVRMQQTVDAVMGAAHACHAVIIGV